MAPSRMGLRWVAHFVLVKACQSPESHREAHAKWPQKEVRELLICGFIAAMGNWNAASAGLPESLLC